MQIQNFSPYGDANNQHFWVIGGPYHSGEASVMDRLFVK
jgi:hypothetical protein